MRRLMPGADGAKAARLRRSDRAGSNESSSSGHDAPPGLGCLRHEAQTCATGCGAAQSAQLLDLGDDALLLCFAHLPLDGRACLAATCCRLRALADHAPLWIELRFRGTRAPVCEATLCALITRARASAGAAFSCLDLDGANVAGDLQVTPQLLTGTWGVGAQLVELRLGECAALSPAAAAALASKDTFPLLRDGGASFRLAFDEPGIARLAAGEALPRGCSVSLESGRCKHGRLRDDIAVNNTFATAFSAVAAAGGTLYRVSTCGHRHYTRNTGYRAAGLAALVKLAPAAFAPLASLDLRDSIMPEPEERIVLAAALAGCTQLARVTLSGRKLWPAELYGFAALPSLTSLDISKAGLCGWDMPSRNVATAAAALRAGLLARGGAARLLALNADGCALRDAGARELAAALADGARLRELRLGNNGITCAGATALALGLQDGAHADARRGEVHPLRTLSLAQNGVCREGAVTLARALTSPGVGVAVLDLGMNEFGDASAEALASALAAPHCSLTHLLLHGCRCGPRGAKALAAALRSNTTLEQLHITGCSLREEGMLALLAAMGGDGRDQHGDDTNAKVKLQVSDWPANSDACDEAMERLGERLAL